MENKSLFQYTKLLLTIAVENSQNYSCWYPMKHGFKPSRTEPNMGEIHKNTEWIGVIVENLFILNKNQNEIFGRAIRKENVSSKILTEYNKSTDINLDRICGFWKKSTTTTSRMYFYQIEIPLMSMELFWKSGTNQKRIVHTYCNIKRSNTKCWLNKVNRESIQKRIMFCGMLQTQWWDSQTLQKKVTGQIN